MKDLLHSRFIQTVLSADMSTEPTEAMEYCLQFYTAATSLLHWNCRSAMTEKVEFVRFILLFAV